MSHPTPRIVCLSSRPPGLRSTWSTWSTHLVGYGSSVFGARSAFAWLWRPTRRKMAEDLSESAPAVSQERVESFVAELIQTAELETITFKSIRASLADSLGAVAGRDFEKVGLAAQKPCLIGPSTRRAPPGVHRRPGFAPSSTSASKNASPSRRAGAGRPSRWKRPPSRSTCPPSGPRRLLTRPPKSRPRTARPRPPSRIIRMAPCCGPRYRVRRGANTGRLPPKRHLVLAQC
eukprot:5350939-Prymnesium_polylepis.1